jgi:hypothetical protein
MKPTFEGLFEIRDMQPSDKNFVLATFLRGIYHGDSWFSKIPRGIFMQNYKVFAEALIDTTNKVTVKVACLPDDKDIIMGYSILSADYQTIHFVYVKEAWRKKGIARALLPKFPTTVTHLTDLGSKLLHKFENVTFNPFK